ncbi:MAG: hypothetical protein Q9186_003002 [Xanthomendoza sp. 1 TL-2023]
MNFQPSGRRHRQSHHGGTSQGPDRQTIGLILYLAGKPGHPIQQEAHRRGLIPEQVLIPILREMREAREQRTFCPWTAYLQEELERESRGGGHGGPSNHQRRHGEQGRHGGHRTHGGWEDDEEEEDYDYEDDEDFDEEDEDFDYDGEEDLDHYGGRGHGRQQQPRQRQEDDTSSLNTAEGKDPEEAAEIRRRQTRARHERRFYGIYDARRRQHESRIDAARQHMGRRGMGGFGGGGMW